MVDNFNGVDVAKSDFDSFFISPSLSIAGDESMTGGFAGASIRVVDKDNLTLVTDMEFGSNSDEDYAAGSVTLEYTFQVRNRCSTQLSHEDNNQVELYRL